MSSTGTDRQAPQGDRRVVLASVGAISFVTLLSEISLTRVTSYVLFYPFAYVLIGLALLGLGLGAAAVTLQAETRWTAERAAVGFLGFGSGVAAALAALAFLPFDLRRMVSDGTQAAVWLTLALATASPFFATGVVLASAFRTGGVAPSLLYAADLGCAALASAAVIPMLSSIGPIRTLGLATLTCVGAAAWLSGRKARAALLGAPALALMSFFAVNHLSAFRPALGKHLVPWAKPIYSAWHALFRIDVTGDWPTEAGNVRRPVWHDANFGTSFLKLKSEDAASKEWDGSIKQVPFAVVKQPRVLIIGAAGGSDIAVALHFGAAHVVGVELHPRTTELIRGAYADFTGRLVEDPRVEYVNAEGRRYAQLHPGQFDLVQLVSPDSYAAQPGAQYVLVESYLYTREALATYWNALTDRGLIALEIGDPRDRIGQNGLRLIAQARDFLESVGVINPAAHLVVVQEPAWATLWQVMVSRHPFSKEALQRLRKLTSGSRMRFLVDPGKPSPDPLIRYLAAGQNASSLERFGLGYLDLSAATDDRPFFFTYYHWLPLLRGKVWWGLQREAATGQALILVLLGIAGVALLATLGLPFIVTARSRLPSGLPALGLAVSLLGWGFISIEVNTIQRLTLYLGYPTYALTAVLSGILLGAGAGSAWSEKREHRLVIWTGITMVAAMALATAFVLPPLLEATLTHPLGARAATALAWALAQGFGLGLFFPTALSLLSQRGPRWVAWGWAVNGTASVFGSTIAVLTAMVCGFQRSALAAAAGYALAATLLFASARASLPAAQTGQRLPP